MMNFLDLSAASEEERRIIKDILSDTSVVNFAESLRQQYQSQPEQNQQQYRNNQPTFNKLQHQQNNHYTHHHQQTQPIKVKLHQHQHQQQQQHQLQHQQQHRHQQQQPQQNFQPHHQDNSFLNNTHTNHVHNHNVLRDQANMYHQQMTPSVGSTANNASPSTAFNPNLSPQNITSTSTNTTTNSIDSNRTNSRSSYAINNSNANNGNIKSQNYPVIPQDDISPPPSALLSTSTSAPKSTTPIQNSLPNDATFTASNVTQSTSSVPPQTIANQMPQPMAGDMNSVIGIDMASSQPQGYPMPPPPPTHVTAFGPAPPPAPHVYGGPPIFQPYPHYITFPYNMPYPMSYVMPPTNSIVTNRQQLTPQSGQQANSILSNNSHPRSHAHHPRSNKLKDLPKQHQHHNQHQHHQHQVYHANHQQHGYRANANFDPHINQVNDVSEQQGDSYEDYVEKSAEQQQLPLRENSIENSKVNLDQQPQHQYQEQPMELPQVNRATDDATRMSNEEEAIKVSSDEGFDTQSSLDLSKQSHESSNVFVSDKSRSPKEDCNNSASENPEVVLTETNNDEKSQQSQDVKVAGSWGSAASKSWASLFRDRDGINHGTSHNGDSTSMTYHDSSEDDGKVGPKAPTKHDNNVQNSITVASTKEQRTQDAARRAQDKMASKLAQKINSISLKHSLPVLRPRGFINKGNGCYINSTLQALIACPPFYNLMKEIGDLRGLKRDDSCTPILDSFAELFLNFPPLDTSKKNKQVPSSDQKLQINYLQAEAIEPRCIYNVLGQIKSECLKGAQEDAEEFLSSVLNGLHEEMIGLSETLQVSQSNDTQNGHLSDAEDINGGANNDENLWREVGPKNRSLPIRAATVINSPIQEIFGGSLFSIRTAGKDRCGHRSPFFDLQLDISGDNVKSLQDAIKSFTASEIIQDFYCSKTKQKLDAQRRTSLDQLPPILILHLKQFIYTQDHGLRKLMKRIEYPIDFELPEGCLHDKNSDKSLKNSRSYKLLAVVYHEGKEAVKGHYLTDVYHIGSSQWIRCDDSNLKVVPAPRIENPDSSRTPYLLFYRRLNTLGPRQSNIHDNKKKN